MTLHYTLPTFLLHLLHSPQLVHIVRIIEPKLHADKRLPAFQAEFVPRFRPGQQVRHRALSQTQDGLPEKTLTCGEQTYTVCDVLVSAFTRSVRLTPQCKDRLT